MDTQSLKMILDTLHDAGVGAWWIALLYILQGYLQILAICGVIVTVVLRLSRMLFSAISLRGELERVTGLSLDQDRRFRNSLIAVVVKHGKEIENDAYGR